MTSTLPAPTADFAQLGYVVIQKAISPELRVSLRVAAEELVSSTTIKGRDRGADGKDGFRGCLALNPDAFLPLVANPAVLPTVVDLLSPNLHILSTQLIALPSIPPGGPREIRTPKRPGWHRDLYGVDTDLGSAHTPRLAIKCAYYLTDITPDCGITMLLPGSHLSTQPPHIPAGHADPPGAITPALDPAGTDALLFENRTWHAGGLNTSGQPRLAVMVQYGYRWLAPIDDPATHLLVLPNLTDVERQLLGAPDRKPDGSVAKGRGAEPLRHWVQAHRDDQLRSRSEPQSNRPTHTTPRRSPVPYNPDELFRSTAPYYARYRSGYPADLFDHLVERFGLDGTQQVMDLGCGTGQIALPLARHVARVIAVDPEPSMLTEGQHLAKDQEIHNIDWIVGDSYKLSELDLPRLNLVTMGAAFHWMDRHAVLGDLDRLVPPDGAVVVASGGAPANQTPPPWNDTIAAIRTKYLGPARRAGSGTYSHPEEGHDDVLRRSPFSNVDVLGWDWTLERDLDSLIGLQFSFSYSAPAQFDSDDQRNAFERELREALTEQFPSGVFREEIHTEALIATRP